MQGTYDKPKTAKKVTGAAADRVMRDIVQKTKSGKGTLTYTPKRPPSQKGRGGK